MRESAHQHTYISDRLMFRRLSSGEMPEAFFVSHRDVEAVFVAYILLRFRS